MAMPSFNWPPGLLLLVQTAHLWLFPPLLVLLVHQYASLKLPASIWIAAYLLATPTLHLVKGVSQYLREEREIKQLGARRLPVVPSKWPGAPDLLYDVMEGFDNGYPGEVWAKWNKTLGPVSNARMLGADLVTTTDPDHIKAFLSTDFDNFEKGDTFRWCLHSVLGTGVLNADGDMWKFHRGMTRRFFARDRVTDFDLFNRHSHVAIGKLKERFAQGEPVDFQDIMGRFTMDSATEFLFGSKVDSLHAPWAYAHNSSRRNIKTQPHPSTQFAEAFNQAQTQIARRSRLTELWPFAEFWKDMTQDSMKVIHDLIDPILMNALAKKRRAEHRLGAEANQSETLLDHLVGHTDDPVVLRDETLNIMIAGRDTTMASLTFAVYCLSQHPDVLTTLRNEILTKVGPTRRPTFDDVKDCRYLRAVINETLRLYPSVPFDIRHSKRSTTWRATDGGKRYYIPGNVDVMYAVWLMHRRKDLWGPDADKFDPMRFLDERLKYIRANPYIFLPFNAGPRICIGQQFAYNETSFMIIRLLQAFDSITLIPDAQPPESRPPAHWKQAEGTQATEKIWPKSHLTLYSYMGLWLKMGEATYVDTVRNQTHDQI